ncbi:MAG: acyl-CoA thioesterase [Flammeovirgaceae bacterium]
MIAYQKTFEVKWADVDPNNHLRNTVYVDFTDHVRFSYFDSQGLDYHYIRKLGIGPIFFKVCTSFYKEVLLHETITVNLKLAYLSESGDRWSFEHEVLKADGRLAAKVEVQGAFLNLKTRKLANPSEEMNAAIRKLERTKDFKEAVELGEK